MFDSFVISVRYKLQSVFANSPRTLYQHGRGTVRAIFQFLQDPIALGLKASGTGVENAQAVIEVTLSGSTYENGQVVFTTNHFSTYAIVFEDASSPSGGGFPIWIIAVIAVVAIAAIGGVFFFMQQKKKA